MRPIRLTMSAFGSYACEETIDFSHMKGGLFLVAGDTGSGKTTIFDGITYALYDKTSGGRRDGSMMRSQYASVETPTFVELVFLYRGRQYRVRRNPEYTRKSKRRSADGTYKEVTEPATVSLTLPDGQEFRGRKKETDAEIIRLLGVDFGQFVQIAMIAQGDFMNLLIADSKERKRIFSHIFRTGFYERVQEELRLREKESRRQLDRLFDDRLLAVKRIKLSFADETERLCAHEFVKACETNAAGGAGDISRVTQMLGHYCERLGLREENMQRQADALRKQQTELAVQLRRMQEAKEQKERLRKNEEQLEIYKREEKQIADLDRQAEIGESAAVVYEKRQQYERSQKELLSIEKTYKELVMRADLLDGQIPSLQKQYESLERTRENTERAYAEQKQILQTILPKLEQLASLKIKKHDAMLRLRDSLSRHKEMTERYEYALGEYISGQAGALAKDLCDGKPCPVCGSLSHPKPAALRGCEVSKEQVEQARLDTQKTEQEKLTCQQAADRLQVQYDQLDSERADAEKKLGIKLETEKVRDRLHCIEQESAETGRKLEAGRRELEETRRSRERVVGERDRLAKQAQDLRDRVQHEKKAYEEQMTLSGFQTEDEFEAAVIHVSDWRSKRECVRKYREDVGRLEAVIETQREQLPNISADDLEQAERLRIQADELEKNICESDACIKQLYTERKNNTDVLRELEVGIEQFKRRAAEYENVAALGKTAAGQLGKTAKIDLETYVQRVYFEQIIREANRRLLKMSGGEFVLKCRALDKLDMQKQSGLDLDVVHMAGGSVRDIRSLSGGESFMAALAMALGLADMISSRVGAVQLDTMFVDEGFGTLDDEARNRAVAVLTDLAQGEKMIGIISHVSELKEQIDRQLSIKKDSRGSRAQWVF